MRRPGLPRAAAACAAAAALLALAGCAGLLREAARDAPMEDESPAGGRDARERMLQRVWVGRTRQELVQRLGLPSLVMDVPGFRLPETYVVVYKGRDPVGGCIDAFVVLKDGSERIQDVFCR